jgi:hypothetical protein
MNMRDKVIAIVVPLATMVGLQPLLQMPLWAVMGLISILACIVIVWSWTDLRVPRNASLRPVKTFTTIPDYVIFAYGSLLVPDSLLRSLPDDAFIPECIPARLKTYRLSWGAYRGRDDLISKDGRVLSSGIRWASLVAEKGGQTDQIDGALLGVFTQGFLALQNRETSYRLQEVKSLVTPVDTQAELPTKPIMVFLPEEENDETRGRPNDVYVRKGYYQNIRNALRRLGFRPLRKPAGLRLREAYLVNEMVEDTLRCRRGEVILRRVHHDVQHDMETAEEKLRKIKYALRPLCLPESQYQRVAKAAETAVRLSSAALKLVARDRELGPLCGWTDEELDTLRHSMARADHMPRIARVDMTFSGSRLLIFEVNADSPGGMHHLDIVSARQASALASDKRLDWIQCAPAEVSERVLDALMNAVGAPGVLSERPLRAALVEYKPEEWATYPEMKFLANLLTRGGIPARIVDLAEDSLVYSGGRLCHAQSGEPIDLVYKRILWSDMPKSHPPRREALRQAYRDSSVCVANSFAARMAGSKAVLVLMKAREFPAMLAAAGEPVYQDDLAFIVENLPFTRIWGDAADGGWIEAVDKKQILGDVRRYVLKLRHGFGGDKMVIGLKAYRASAIFEDLWNKGYVVQEYVPHGRALVPIHTGSEVVWKYEYYILGAYVIEGHCVAIEAKTSATLPVNMKTGARRTAVFPTTR